MEVNPEAIHDALARKKHALGQAVVRSEDQADGTKAWAVRFPKAPRRLTPEERQSELTALKNYLLKAFSVGFGGANLDVHVVHPSTGLLVRIMPRYEPL